MDRFKRNMTKHTGPGGLQCGCCNRYKGKYKSRLNRLGRSKTKSQDKESIENGIADFDQRHDGYNSD